ncbi:lipopolysaccharide assembly protein LapB [uncultured Thiodictyon sp.]|uniref:lipopolysaccharide assembly protein LapB n=1 Tax=uncultured Thiodictyon sp. TaxID=1846217 RepID=UPI0025EFCD5F|nr:lipopolysaccharide assembly protein LapB [uncultured Thiodictyon sp.]
MIELQQFLLFLLLPVAAASGWWFARRDWRSRCRVLPVDGPAFFRGLNYLLDEQPDKAIDVFLALAEVDGETAEIHLALGSLFRRRGEADRAIRIHQNLIARKTLSAEQRGFALFELGQDYMRAGLLDRAELLFRELAELGLQRERALRGLLDIYQQERDWDGCLEIAERLRPFCERAPDAEIAHYHCEVAEEARRRVDPDAARRALERAQAVDPLCVRATIIAGQMALADGERAAAVELFLRVAEQGARYVPEVLPGLMQALDELGRTDLIAVLETLAASRPSGPVVLALSEALRRERGPAAAAQTLTQYLAGNVDLAALERLLDLQAGAEPGADPYRAAVVHEVVRHLLTRQSAYQCDHCGFAARALHWQCPSCKRWGSVQPVQPERIPGDEVLREPRLA